LEEPHRMLEKTSSILFSRLERRMTNIGENPLYPRATSRAIIRANPSIAPTVAISVFFSL
jgi:hypothetical protein